jgi:RNA polymerase-associated protein CTR9
MADMEMAEAGDIDDGDNARSLFIPVQQSDEMVEVFVDELPDDVHEVLGILKAEIAPLNVWLEFAVRI